MGRELLFARSFCDSLLCLVYSSRSSYSAATSFLASLWSGFGLRRQLIFLLGRCFVATLQSTPELFVCPKYYVNPDYIVIDGQALSFQLRDGINVARLRTCGGGRDDRRPRGCPSGVAHVRAVVRENGHL